MKINERDERTDHLELFCSSSFESLSAEGEDDEDDDSTEDDREEDEEGEGEGEGEGEESSSSEWEGEEGARGEEEEGERPLESGKTGRTSGGEKGGGVWRERVSHSIPSKKG